MLSLEDYHKYFIGSGENDIKYSGRKVEQETRVKDQVIRLISCDYNFCEEEEKRLKAIDKQSNMANTVIVLEPDKSKQGNEFLTTLAVWNMLICHHQPHPELHVEYHVKGKAAKKSFKGVSENKSQEDAFLLISAILNISGDIEQNPGPRSRG